MSSLRGECKQVYLGSSSGIPLSILLVKSAPTSALFVNIPPPTRAKMESVVAPIPKPAITPKELKASSLNIKYMMESPKSPHPTTERP
jgi:hypothetical protein